MKGISDNAVKIISSAIGHHLDTVANNYDAWFLVWDYLTQLEYCLNCADQASIAAPGETVLCKTHADEKHYADMKEFFIEQGEHLIFKPVVPFCSCCGTEHKVVYAGIIITNSGQPLAFSFCIDCRDELTLKRNATSAKLEEKARNPKYAHLKSVAEQMEKDITSNLNRAMRLAMRVNNAHSLNVNY